MFEVAQWHRVLFNLMALLKHGQAQKGFPCFVARVTEQLRHVPYVLFLATGNQQSMTIGMFIFPDPPIQRLVSEQHLGW